MTIKSKKLSGYCLRIAKQSPFSIFVSICLIIPYGSISWNGIQTILIFNYQLFSEKGQNFKRSGKNNEGDGLVSKVFLGWELKFSIKITGI